MRKKLLFLSLLSGFGGIAYELLYTRLLTTYLGDMLVVAAGILATFLLGLGLGARVAHRLLRWLWAIEAGIGLYAVAMALVVSSNPAATLALLAPLGASPAKTLIVLALLLAVPSMLIGCSVPLFAQLIARHRDAEGGGDFSWVYASYNVGAGICVLGLELLLITAIGIRDSLFLIASLNLAVGLALWRLRPADSGTPPVVEASTQAPRRPLIALFAASVLSGIYQLLILRIASILFGPFHQHFAMLLFLSLTGLSLGAWLVERYRWSLVTTLAASAFALALSASAIHLATASWTALGHAFVGLGPVVFMVKLGVMALLALPATAAIGATVPALVRASPHEPALPGRALAASSFGNCAGYLAAVLVVLAHADEALALGLLALAFALLCLWLLGRNPGRGLATVVASACVLAFALPLHWPAQLAHLDYGSFLEPRELARVLAETKRVEHIRRYNSQLTILYTAQGGKLFTVNGYSSVAANEDGETNVREVLVGVAPALYAPRRERALVLGTGSGVTAGAAALMFEHVDTVEIDPAVQAALPRFAEQNFDLLARDNVELIVADGLTQLSRSDAHYDVIINTVTSPVYFSSSKLYSRELFELAKTRLRPGGVYTLWLDGRLTDEGAAILLETMRQSFDECHFVVLTHLYVNAICGDTLRPRALPEGAWPERLQRVLSRASSEPDPNRLLADLIVVPGRFADTRFHADANTFDRPVLERAAVAGVGVKRDWKLFTWLEADPRQSALSPTLLRGERLATRCFTLLTLGRGDPLGCVARMTAENEGFPPAFLERVTARGQDPGRTAQFYMFAGDRDRALALARSAECKRDVGCHVARLEVLGTLQDDVADEVLAAAVMAGPMNPDIRRWLARIAARRGEREAALSHLRLLDRLGALNSDDRALGQQLTGSR